MDLPGFAGTPERVTSPAPAVEPHADKQPDIPTVAPYLRSGLETQQLRFTGFRQTIIMPTFAPAFTAPNVKRQKVRIRAGRWVVREWQCWTAALGQYVVVLPVWSSGPSVDALATDDLGGDNPLGAFQFNGTGYHWGLWSNHLANASRIPLGFLLPEGEIFLGVHQLNTYGSGVTSQSIFCVDEVAV
jgi:hypothetical protein